MSISTNVDLFVVICSVTYSVVFILVFKDFLNVHVKIQVCLRHLVSEVHVSSPFICLCQQSPCQQPNGVCLCQGLEDVSELTDVSFLVSWLLGVSELTDVFFLM